MEARQGEKSRAEEVAAQRQAIAVEGGELVKLAAEKDAAKAGTAAPQAATQAAAGATTTSGGSGSCSIVDTDLGLDDYRAIAAL